MKNYSKIFENQHECILFPLFAFYLTHVHMYCINIFAYFYQIPKTNIKN